MNHNLARHTVRCRRLHCSLQHDRKLAPTLIGVANAVVNSLGGALGALLTYGLGDLVGDADHLACRFGRGRWAEA